MTIVKIVGLAMQPKRIQNERKGSKYPWGDQITDLSVIAAVYFIILLLEVLLSVWVRGRGYLGKANGAESVEMVGTEGETEWINTKKENSQRDLA